jgi:hypothetical protein
MDIFYPKRGQKEAFFDHLPTSSCPRSFGTTPCMFELPMSESNLGIYIPFCQHLWIREIKIFTCFDLINNKLSKRSGPSMDQE